MFVATSRSNAYDASMGSQTVLAQRRQAPTFGSQLRAARLAAGYTLQEIAPVIGYTWVAVQRWETDQCLPKPGVLLHLRAIYGAEQRLELPPIAPAPTYPPVRLLLQNTKAKPRRV